jgi:hypothetical protein
VCAASPATKTLPLRAPGPKELLDTALRQIEDVGEIGIEPVEADGGAL